MTGPPDPPVANSLSRAVARTWIDRYEAMMSREIDLRAAQLAAVVDVARQRLSTAPHPRLLDLGCGPGTLARQLADVLPAATVIGVDADPVLRGLGAAMQHPRVVTIDATIAEPGWSQRLDDVAAVDLAVAVAVVHYLDDAQARQWYTQVAALLSPDGALVIADAFDEVTPAASDRTTTPDAETWTGWWAAVAADPLLQRLWPGSTAPTCDGDERPKLRAHTDSLRAAGFGTVATVWQGGGHAVLVATR